LIVYEAGKSGASGEVEALAFHLVIHRRGWQAYLVIDWMEIGGTRPLWRYYKEALGDNDKISEKVRSLARMRCYPNEREHRYQGGTANGDHRNSLDTDILEMSSESFSSLIRTQGETTAEL
jgi:hypothetical protein